jgi:tetratricopeptide (TPR) repeat protein
MVEDKPSSASEYVERGNTFMNGRKYDLAIADFSQAIAMDPNNITALADRAIGHVWKGDYAAAETDLAAAEKIDSGNAIALRARALAAEMQGECDKAIDFYTRSLAREDNTFAIAHRATCEAQVNKSAEALADSAEALKRQPAWAELHLMRANLFMHNAKRDLAEAEAEAVTRDNPGSDYAWVAAGKILAAVGKRDKAMQAMDKALAIKPYAYIYINRAQIRPASDVAGRMADLDAALKLEPNEPDALSVKAQFLYDQGNYKGALAVLDQIKADPKNSWDGLQRAIVLAKVGRTSEAQKLFQAARSGAKTGPELNSLCWRKSTAGVMLDSALQDCRDALKLSPGAGQILDSLGMVLLKLGRLDEALDAYNQAVAKNTGAASLMGRAFVYLHKGDTAHAEADAAAARKIAGDIDDTFAEYGLRFGAPPAAAGAKAR